MSESQATAVQILVQLVKDKHISHELGYLLAWHKCNLDHFLNETLACNRDRFVGQLTNGSEPALLARLRDHFPQHNRPALAEHPIWRGVFVQGGVATPVAMERFAEVWRRHAPKSRVTKSDKPLSFGQVHYLFTREGLSSSPAETRIILRFFASTFHFGNPKRTLKIVQEGKKYRLVQG